MRAHPQNRPDQGCSECQRPEKMFSVIHRQSPDGISIQALPSIGHATISTYAQDCRAEPLKASAHRHERSGVVSSGHSSAGMCTN